MAKSLEQIKTENPQWADLSDEQLANSLYDEYYSDSFSKEDFYNAIGYEPPKKGGVSFIPDPIERGFWGTAMGIREVQHELGLRSDEDFAQDIANHARKMEELPMGEKAWEQLQRFQSSTTLGEYAANLATSPHLVLETTLESLGAVTGGIGLTAAAAASNTAPGWFVRIAAAAGFGASSYLAEGANQYLEEIEKMGGDRNDPESVQRILSDPERVAFLKDRMRKAGLPPLFFDGVTAGIAGMPFKFIAPKGSSLTRKALAGGTELGIQAAGGAEGARQAQLGLYGEVVDEGELVMEFGLELFTGGPQGIFTTLMADPVQDVRAGKIKNNMSSGLKGLGLDIERAPIVSTKDRLTAEQVEQQAEQLKESGQRISKAAIDYAKKYGVDLSSVTPQREGAVIVKEDVKAAQDVRDTPDPQKDLEKALKKLKDLEDTYARVKEPLAKGEITFRSPAEEKHLTTLPEQIEKVRKKVKGLESKLGEPAQTTTETPTQTTTEAAAQPAEKLTPEQIAEKKKELEGKVGITKAANDLILANGLDPTLIKPGRGDKGKIRAKTVRQYLKKQKKGIVEPTKKPQGQTEDVNQELDRLSEYSEDNYYDLADSIMSVDDRIKKLELRLREKYGAPPSELGNVEEAITDPDRLAYNKLQLENEKRKARLNEWKTALHNSETGQNLTPQEFKQQSKKDLEKLDELNTKLSELDSTYDSLQEQLDNPNLSDEEVVQLQERREFIAQERTSLQDEYVNEATKFQKTKTLTDIPLSDFTEFFGGRVGATKLTAEAAAEIGPLAKKILDIIQRVAGPYIDVEIVNELVDLQNAKTPQQAVRGAQFLNMILIAVNQRTNPNAVETGYHESLHLLFRSDFFKNPKIQKIIKRDIKRYKKFITDNTDIAGLEFEAYLKTPEGIEELVTSSFGLVASQWDADGKITRQLGMSPESHSLFRRLYNLINDIWNTVRRSKFRTLDDIFVSAYEGELAVSELINYDNKVRYQAIADTQAASYLATEFDMEGMHDFIAEAAKNDNKQGVPFIFPLVRFMRTKMGLADMSSLWSAAFNTQAKNTEEAHALNTKYAEIGAPFFNIKNKEIRYGLSEIMLFNNTHDQSVKYLDDGTMSFYDPTTGETVTVKNVEAVQAYKALQDMAKEIMTDAENFYRYKVIRAFPELPDNFSIKDLENLMNQPDLDKRLVKKLENIIENFQQFKKMKSIDYVPKLRFGNRGLVIYEKNPDAEDGLGSQVFFGTVELRKGAGKYTKNKLHPLQVQKIVEKIKEKGYDNTDEYVILGDMDDQGNYTVQTDLDNLQFFNMTRDKESKMVNDRFNSYDAMISMMGTRIADAARLGDLRTELREELETSRAQMVESEFSKGFSKQFAKANDVEGYSTDWDRVWKAYYGGAAKNNAYMRFMETFSKIKMQAEKSEDPAIKKGIDDYMRYVENGQEDQQGLRAFNFFFAMGLNPSTAILQYVNLPTLSLMTMNGFHASARNPALIMKWTKYGGRYWKNKAVKMVDGSPVIQVKDAKTWEDIIERNVKRAKDKDQARATYNRMKDFAGYMYDRGVLGAVMVEESIATSLPGEMTATEKVGNVLERAVKLSGYLVSVAEQNTRFGTSMAILEQLLTDPTALANAKAQLSKSKAFQGFAEMNPNLSFEEQAALFSLHKAHGMFGKDARPDAFKSFGGSVFMPFMTWPAFAWGLMYDMAVNRGTEGKLALMMNLSIMMLLGGVMGLPGSDALKEIFEAIWGTLTGDERDMLEMIHDGIENQLIAETVTRGGLMSLGQINASSRISIPGPGQQIPLAMAGLHDDIGAQFGVLGSLLKNMRDGYQNYAAGGSFGMSAAELLPVALSNVVKAYKYSKEGVRTGAGKTTLLGPPGAELTDYNADIFTITSRVLGFEDANITRQREAEWWTKVKNLEHRKSYTRIKGKIINSSVNYIRAVRANETKKAQKYHNQMERYWGDFHKWADKKKYYVPVGTLMSSINREIASRLTGAIDYKQISKPQREEAFILNKKVDERMRREWGVEWKD